MKLFPYGHATHPQWRMAVALVLAQLRAQMAQADVATTPTLGVLYITDHYAPEAQALLDALSAGLPEVTDWVGGVGVGVCASNAAYVDEPALVVMLCDLAPHQYRVFNGVSPLPSTRAPDGFVAHTVLLHLDSREADVTELVREVAERVPSQRVYGGLLHGRAETVQFARASQGSVSGQGAVGAAGVFHGGLSGVALAQEVPVLVRLTQGVQPVSMAHEVTQCDGRLVLGLDGRPALEVMLADLQLSLSRPTEAVLQLRQTWIGQVDAAAPCPVRGEPLGAEVVVRPLLGVDPPRQGVVLAEAAAPGDRLIFCRRQAAALRADLVRVCTEVREALEPESCTPEGAAVWAPTLEASAPHWARGVAGAIYIACHGRAEVFPGGVSAEMHAVRKALGDVPLIGFLAAGEVAGPRLHSQAGVLLVFPAGPRRD